MPQAWCTKQHSSQVHLDHQFSVVNVQHGELPYLQKAVSAVQKFNLEQLH